MWRASWEKKRERKTPALSVRAGGRKPNTDTVGTISNHKEQSLWTPYTNWVNFR